MRPLRRLIVTALLGLAAGTALASPTAPQEGVDYKLLTPAQPADAGNKVEVIEFFAYYCPHCAAWEPQLEAWVKKQGDNIVFKRVHVAAGESVEPQQRLFYTLSAMGLLPQYHQKAFDAIHVEHLRLSSDDQVFDWAAKNGIDRARFMATYKSFGMPANLRRAAGMMDTYHVEYWPMVVIDGRWVASPSQTGEHMPKGSSEAQQQQATLQVMDALVAKAAAGHR